MKSVYDAADNAELLARINKLSPDSKAQWGKMNVSQMLAHCQVPLQVAFEEVKLKRGLMGILFGKIAKKQLVNNTPFKPNLPTFNEAKIRSEKDFNTEKVKLEALVKRLAGGPDAITKKPHPFFGPLTDHEWDLLHYKHLDHHLRQFGV